MNLETPKIAVVVARLGPYHAARLRALGSLLGNQRAVAIEVADRTATYDWDHPDCSGFKLLTVLQGRVYERSNARARVLGVIAALRREAPDAVAIPGWATAESLAAAAWCRAHERVAIIMSDSQERDARRTLPKEAVKRVLLRAFDSALVAGRTHADYLALLGFDRHRVMTGYDVVDNGHFAQGAQAARADPTARSRLQLPARYFLTCARFVQKKNLLLLLDAYAGYARAAGSAAWHLVLLGAGPLQAQLEAKISAKALHDVVQIRGFRQYHELPAYYGLASAFVLPSLHDQWGLVVNEAMASSLPVLVSETCGAAELVRDGVNGWRFDPRDTDGLVRHFERMSRNGAALAMGKAAEAAIQEWSVDRFARGLLDAYSLGRWKR